MRVWRSAEAWRAGRPRLDRTIGPRLPLPVLRRLRPGALRGQPAVSARLRVEWAARTRRAIAGGDVEAGRRDVAVERGGWRPGLRDRDRARQGAHGSGRRGQPAPVGGRGSGGRGARLGRRLVADLDRGGDGLEHPRRQVLAKFVDAEQARGFADLFGEIARLAKTAP